MRLRLLPKFILLALTLFLTPLISQAQPPTWQIVPNESTLAFTATQNDAPITGSFKTFTGDIQFDPMDLAASKARIVVSLDSVTTDYKEVADTLKAADWFNIKLFPQAVFTTTRFIKTGEGTYQTDGTLTIRDKTFPITIGFDLLEYSDTTTRVKGGAAFRRTAFGVGQGEWAKTDEVKDNVSIQFSLIAKR